MKLTRQTLNGIYAALIVPWTDDDQLDEQRWIAEINAYSGTGIHGIYTGGTTGEFYAQDDATFERITAIACEQARHIRLPIQIGCTALATRTARLRIRIARKHRADAIQIAIPFWLELKDDEVVEFFRGITGEAGETPIVAYETGRAKRKFTPEFLGVLCDKFPTLIGSKNTGCTPDEVREFVRVVPDYALFGGENDLLEKMQAGGRGAYSSITGFNAPRVVELYELCTAGRWAEAKPIQVELHDYLFKAIIPLVTDGGLMDSAADRVQRILGGVDVGLRCQSPYRSATREQLETARRWCQEHVPHLLPQGQHA